MPEDQAKRGPGRPPKNLGKPYLESDRGPHFEPETHQLSVSELPKQSHWPASSMPEPILSAQFREAVRLGVSGQIETSATTGNKGVASIAADWDRRVLTVITRDAQKRECTDYVPLESVKSMRPMPAQKTEAVA